MTPLVFEVPDLRDGYVAVVAALLAQGREVSPRGQRTLELSPVTVAVANPRAVVPVGVGRKLNPAIGVAESCHLLGGVSDAAQMVSITRNFAPFVEAGRLRGAYGPRAYAQLARAVAALARDPDTRQAGAVVWRPWDTAEPTADLPCTVELHLLLRGGRLDAHATMRSCDVFWGLPYDAWMFANAQCAAAHALGVAVGTYYHHAVSLHAYVDRDLAALEALRPYDGAPAPPMLADDVDPVAGDPAGTWRAVARWARAACGAGTPPRFVYPPSAAWYAERLRPHRGAASQRRLCPACRYVLPSEGFADGLCEPCGAALGRAR